MTTILQMLEKHRVFSIAKEIDEFLFYEECDRHYVLALSRDEVRQLAAELIALAGDQP